MAFKSKMMIGKEMDIFQSNDKIIDDEIGRVLFRSEVVPQWGAILKLILDN